MSKPLGIILYKGKSQIDGKPIVAIATGTDRSTKNGKTGNLLPVWILRTDISPILAKKMGYDFSICGDCKHRDFGSCYVNMTHGPEPIFRAFHNDRYDMLNESHIDLIKENKFRLGAYGDPSAVPTDIWEFIAKFSKGWTGYTHQWNNPKISSELKKYCMASCDTVKDYEKAQSLGWKTFRVKLPGQEPLSNEFVCPASKEKGHRMQCDKCLCCCGTTKNLSKCPVIEVHGAQFKIDKFIKGIKKVQNKKKYRVNFEERRKQIFTFS